MERKFEETSLGHFLKHEAPTEYGMILYALGTKNAPSADFIEAISYSSTNPLFRKEKFRRSLIKYRKTGLYSGRSVRFSNAKVEHYYTKLRRKQLLEGADIKK